MKNYILGGADGKTPMPINDPIEWAKRFHRDNRIVAQDTVNDVHVSTVFLGIDHNWGDGPPILFETMIFGGQHDEYQERYPTWAEAEEGHKRALALIQT